MNQIKNFIEKFLSAENDALTASLKPNLEDYNTKLTIMNSFCVKELHNKFGLIPHTTLKSNDFYERWHDADPVNSRNIFKISHYQDKIYGDVYVVYISPRNPNNIIFMYGECLFVTEINGELKIIKVYGFGDKMQIKDKFETTLGVEDISFKTLGKPIEIERYREPEDDEDAMEHYLADI